MMMIVALLACTPTEDNLWAALGMLVGGGLVCLGFWFGRGTR